MPKVSQLPEASELAGDEHIPISQDGVTKRTSASAVAALATGGEGGVNSLDELVDVSTSGAEDGEVLGYNGTIWVPVAQSEGGGGAVDSVNGETGTVVLTAAEVGADAAGAAAAAQAAAIQRANHTGSQAISTVTGLQTALNAKADDSAVVHDTGSETIAGTKTFSSSPIVPTPTNNTEAANKAYVDLVGGGEGGAVASVNGESGIVTLDAADVGADPAGSASAAQAAAVQRANHTGSQAISTVTNLQTTLDAKALDSAVVHDTGAETIDGVKTFSSSPVVPTPTTDTQVANKVYVDDAIEGLAELTANDPTEVDLDTVGSVTTITLTPEIARDADVVHDTGNETIAGIKTFSSSPVVPTPSTGTQVANKAYVDSVGGGGGGGLVDAIVEGDGITVDDTDPSNPIVSADVTTAELATKADDSAVVHDTGNETIAGVKTFSSSPVVPANSWDISTTNGLQSALDAISASGTLADEDTFTRANVVSGPIGYTEIWHRLWHASAGWSLTSNQIHRDAGYGIQWMDAHTSSNILETQIAAGAASEWYICCRLASDHSSYLLVGVSDAGIYDTVFVDPEAPGGIRGAQVRNTINTPPTPANGDVLKVFLHDDDGFDVLINDVHIWNGGDTLNVGSRLVGVAANGSTPRFEYFRQTPTPGGLTRAAWFEDYDDLATKDYVDDAVEGLEGGAVASVNGDTGVVVLTAADVGADASGSAAAAQAAAIQRANHTGSQAISTVTGLQAALDAKAIDADVVHDTGTETIAGVKTFSSAPVVPDSSFTIAKTTGLQTALDAKAADADVVHDTGTETIAGVKTFSSSPVVPDASFTIAKTTGLQTALDAKAVDADVVHDTGTETIAGVKTFSSSPIVPTPTTDFQSSTKKYVDDAIGGLAELTADDPTEVDIDTVGAVTTITLTPEIARLDDVAVTVVDQTRLKVPTHYFFPINGGTVTTSTTTLSRLTFTPVWLRAGTIDRIGVDVSTAVATAVGRFGIYEDNGSGEPGDLIAEGAATQDLNTLGWAPVTISAVLPTTARYHLAFASQTAAGTIRVITGGDPLAPITLGTSLPSSNSVTRVTYHNSGVTGALPSTAGAAAYTNTYNPFFILRYSA